MHPDVFSVDVILSTGCPQVPLIEEVDVQLVRHVLYVHETPHPDVELPLLVEKGPLDVLLDYPLRVWWLFVQVCHYFPNLGEKLDSFTLV